MRYDDDFYNEPSEFETQVEEFKEGLARAIRSEFLEEMERLKEENRNLREIRENFERKKSECDRVMHEAEDKARRMRVEELMERYSIFLWRPKCKFLYGPKCDKCDKHREIEVVLPSGKTVEDECQCGKSMMKVMFPERMVRCELADRDRGIAAWYIACGEDGDRYYKLECYGSVFAGENMVQPGTSFDVLEKMVDQTRLLFSTREECLAYCGYLNEKNHVPTDTIYNLDGEIWKSEEEKE